MTFTAADSDLASLGGSCHGRPSLSTVCGGYRPGGFLEAVATRPCVKSHRLPSMHAGQDAQNVVQATDEKQLVTLRIVTFFFFFFFFNLLSPETFGCSFKQIQKLPIHRIQHRDIYFLFQSPKTTWSPPPPPISPRKQHCSLITKNGKTTSTKKKV